MIQITKPSVTMSEQIILQVKNGIISVECLPENIELVIKDFDVKDTKMYIETVKNVEGEFIYTASN